jgi:5-(carboxyamino)imidazole ribonucleotide synthase
MSDAKPLVAPVPPGGTIGILGGGQLGRMLAMAAARLGLKAHIYSDVPDAPAFQACDAHTVAPFEDEAALAKFATACDAVTYEFENVPAKAASVLAKIKPTNPNAMALGIAQDRFNEKSFIHHLGREVAPFAEVNTEVGMRSALSDIGMPAVLKTRKFGYDGKGQAKIRTTEEGIVAIRAMKNKTCILEGFVDFEYEASVISVRAANGEFAAYDPAENTHENHILRRSVVPSRMTSQQIAEAKAIAHHIADALAYVGVLGVELFVTKGGSLLVNEIAPRVHNSGHWTIDACLCSQFENHIRAIAGWPIGSTARHSDAVMDNIIGEEAAGWNALAAKGGALHLYGKSEMREGRKMGHVTYLKPLSK